MIRCCNADLSLPQRVNFVWMALNVCVSMKKKTWRGLVCNWHTGKSVKSRHSSVECYDTVTCLVSKLNQLNSTGYWLSPHYVVCFTIAALDLFKFSHSLTPPTPITVLVAGLGLDPYVYVLIWLICRPTLYGIQCYAVLHLRSHVEPRQISSQVSAYKKATENGRNFE